MRAVRHLPPCALKGGERAESIRLNSPPRAAGIKTQVANGEKEKGRGIARGGETWDRESGSARMCEEGERVMELETERERV